MSTEELSVLLSEDINVEPPIAGAPLLTGNHIQVPLLGMLRHSSPEDVTANPLIMIVDDEPINAKLARKYLSSEGYREFVVLTDPTMVVDAIATQQPDIVLLDIMMPNVSGLEILEKVRADERFVDLPIIIVTAATDAETNMKALKLGATDFLTKPVDHPALIARVRNVLAAKAHQDGLKKRAWELEIERPVLATELRAAQQELVIAVAKAVESRGRSNGKHVVRVGRYAGIIAAKLELEHGIVNMIEQAAALHDIGKIGVSDVTTHFCSGHECPYPEQAPGNREDSTASLGETPEEYQRQYQAHTEIGARILGDAKSPLLRMAAKIALTHHERWDGKGYPMGIAGPNIPIEGRITAVADAFDLLCDGDSSGSPHRLDDCFGMLETHKGTRFDPEIVDAFVSCGQEVLAVQEQYPG